MLLFWLRKLRFKIKGWLNDWKIWNVWEMRGLLKEMGKDIVFRLVCFLLLIVIVFLILDGFNWLGFILSLGIKLEFI